MSYFEKTQFWRSFEANNEEVDLRPNMSHSCLPSNFQKYDSPTSCIGKSGPPPGVQSIDWFRAKYLPGLLARGLLLLSVQSSLKYDSSPSARSASHFNSTSTASW